ncbi:S66 family peptidase [Butyrivibrio sp. VCB2006]|uniref:S66 family peptidase n=1 Tax=Butyrivibrio sp. VCB2006 TaxID=1280679 RepID=UPI000415DE2D|nr:S66 peptidase family protein [Butyrivibrio sp. VCB2006]
MRYPEFLKPGGTIGFVAPSFGCTFEPYISRFENARKNFTEMGYKLDIGPNCDKAEGIGISNIPEKCGAELNDYYKSDQNDVLMSVGGGELMDEVVPFIDFKGVSEAKPKWYMGYSDNTNFIFPSVTLADTAAIYAPCAGDFGMVKWHPAVSDAWDLITGKKLSFESYDKWEMELPEDPDNLCSYYVTEPNRMKVYPVGGQNVISAEKPIIDGSDIHDEIRFSGRLIGGCLDCLVNLVGTPYEDAKGFSERYSGDGIIWFLEACDLNVYSIRRSLWNLREAGWFSHVKGFLIGRPMAAFGQEMFGLNQYNAVVDVLKEFDVPILMDLDIGHHPPMLPIICGAMAQVTFTDNKLNISYELK